MHKYDYSLVCCNYDVHWYHMVFLFLWSYWTF